LQNYFLVVNITKSQTVRVRTELMWLSNSFGHKHSHVAKAISESIIYKMHNEK